MLANWFAILIAIASMHGAPPERVPPSTPLVGTSPIVASLGQRRSHNRRYSASVIATSSLQVGGNQSWTIHLARRSHRVAHASITAEVWMPEVGVHAPARAIATYIGHGNYRIDSLSFSRPGWWNVSLEIESRFGVDSLAFNVVIPRPDA